MNAREGKKRDRKKSVCLHLEYFMNATNNGPKKATNISNAEDIYKGRLTVFVSVLLLPSKRTHFGF